MTLDPMSGVTPQRQTQQAQQAQKQTLDDATLAELRAKGINPDDPTQMTPEKLKAKEVNATIIAAIFPAQQTAPATSVVQAGQQLNTDKTEIKGEAPTEQDKMRLEKEKVRKQINQEFVNDAKDYSQKDAAFRDKQEEVNQLRANLNQLSKKTMKKTIKDADGNEVNKFEARKKAQEALEKAEDELVALRKDRDAAKAKLEGKEQLSAANQYNVDEANKGEDAKAKQRAARTDVDDYLTSDAGRKAVKKNLITTADGIPLVDKDGKPFKRGSAERAAAYDAIQAEYEKSGNPVSRKGARRIYKARTKDFSSMEKEDSLEKIVIGDKSDYKKAVEEAKKSEEGFDKDMPSVTYMSEELYEKAQKFAKSRGVELPTLEKAKKEGLTGKQLEQFQQLLMDEAGDVGSRLDAKERKALDKDYKDISYTDFRKMFEAGNVDVQRTYNTAAAAIGAATAIGTGLGLGLIDSATEFVAAGIGAGAGGSSGGIGLGDLGSGSGIEGALGEDVTTHSFNWKNAGIATGVGLAVGTGIKAVANYDPNGFHKGVTLEQYVYNVLDKDAAFKKLAPNVKATMAKVIAENKDKSKDEIFAACDRALGDANERINLRESVGADASLRALKNRPKDALPTEKVIVDNKKVDAYYVGGQLIDAATGKPIESKNPIYRVSDGKVMEQELDQGKYDVAGTNADHKLLKRHGVDRSNAAIRDVDENLNLTETMNKTDRAQFVQGQQGHVQIEIGSGTVYAPDKITLGDDTNHKGEFNQYEYVKVTPSPEELKKAGLPADAKGPFYKLVKATNAAGQNITSKSIGEISQMEYVEYDVKEDGYTYETDNEGYTTSRTQIDGKAIHYHMVNNNGRTQSNYAGPGPNTGATPR